MSYNGWSNYETWCVNLWVQNEEPSYRYWRDVTERVWEESEADPPFTRSEVARRQLADMLKDSIEEANPLADSASMWTDLLGAALSEVHWSEIAGNWLSAMEGYER